MADPKHPRHYDEAFKWQIVQSCESGKPSREIRAEYDIARSTPRRWSKHPRPAVGDGGRRFRTSGAGIHTKAGVIRANAARYRRDAGCWASPLPCYWDDRASGMERVDPIAGDVRAVRRDSRGRPGAGRSRLPWKGGASPRPGDASAASCANRVCGRVHAQTIQTARDAGQRGEAREPAEPRVRRLRPAHASRERSCLCLRRRTGC